MSKKIGNLFFFQYVDPEPESYLFKKIYTNENNIKQYDNIFTVSITYHKNRLYLSYWLFEIRMHREGWGGKKEAFFKFFCWCVITAGPLFLSGNDMCGVISSDRIQWYLRLK